MKSPLLSLALLALITALFAFTFRVQLNVSSIDRKPVPAYSQQAIRCSPDWNALSKWLEETDIPPIPGAGTYTWSISSRNDSARFYFNQGLNMYYSFHIIEAMASFKKASRFDPESAMLYWAQALAYGPNINDLGYAASPAALEAVSKAQQYSTGATALEKALINAIAVRYTADSADTNRKQLNEAYTAKMAELYQTFPGQGDVAALYADAMMLEHPWDLWTPDGKPKAWTPLIRQVLEKALVTSPRNPGLNHYYIHVMEPSPEAAKALVSADRLGKLTPGLSHTVHMPSHIYLRTGHYNKGVSVNESAVKSYRQSIPLYKPVTGADFLYIIHNLHMQVNSAMMAGRYTTAAQSSADLVSSIPPDYLDFPGSMGNLIQYIYMTPVFTDIRFGRWNKLLEYTEPPANQVYGRIIWLFGRGMAFTRIQNLKEAKLALNEMKVLSKDTVLTIPFTPFSPAVDGALIANALLEGSIMLEENNLSAAIELFSNAVKTESQMVYNEPRDWLLNPRHYLANAYIIAGRFEDASKTLSEDLAVNNENGWALYGHWLVLTAQNKAKEAALMKARFEKAFSRADIKLNGTIF